jgi:hypothetical protein
MIAKDKTKDKRQKTKVEAKRRSLPGGDKRCTGKQYPSDTIRGKNPSVNLNVTLKKILLKRLIYSFKG